MTQAMQVEKHIKSMKSRIYIENLKRYPEMIIKLIEKYSWLFIMVPIAIGIGSYGISGES